MSAPSACGLIAPMDIVSRVRRRLAELPDVRRDRVRRARTSMALGLPSSGAIAARILAGANEERLCRVIG